MKEHSKKIYLKGFDLYINITILINILTHVGVPNTTLIALDFHKESNKKNKYKIKKLLIFERIMRSNNP